MVIRSRKVKDKQYKDTMNKEQTDKQKTKLKQSNMEPTRNGGSIKHTSMVSTSCGGGGTRFATHVNNPVICHELGKKDRIVTGD